MRARSTTARTGGWKRVPVTRDAMPNVAEQLRRSGCVAGDGDPIAAHAHFDRQNRIRRIHATYENGWRATLSIRIDGSYSLSMALKLVSKPKVAAE
ncbi:MAG TPA: hypothetical protein VF463_10500 [Sphingobium sp.]